MRQKPRKVETSMRNFTLKIKCGNAAMQTRSDIANAVREAADKLEAGQASNCEHTIRDVNGNTVGTWRVNA